MQQVALATIACNNKLEVILYQNLSRMVPQLNECAGSSGVFKRAILSNVTPLLGEVFDI